MKYLYEVQDLLAFFKTQKINLELFSFLQMDHPLGIGFCVCKLPYILLLPRQDHVYLCHVSCHLCFVKV
jgi:hypothetical protein